jgi:cell division protein FtsI (penicillin-binding protein 3)
MNPLRGRRLRLFAIVLLAWAAVVIGRLIQLQLVQGQKYRARAQRQQERRVEVSGRRGSIVDREGRDLAVSVEVPSVYAIGDEIEDAAAAAADLSPLVRVPREKIYARLSQAKGFVWIARKVEPAVADQIRALKVPGIHFVAEPKRFYPKGSLAASVLGYVGLDDHGLSGLEYSYEKVISGKPGEIVALTDARQSTYGESETAGRPAQEGAALTVSLDSGMQFAAEQELESTMRELDAKSGSVVLMDPWNGEILAMASAPGFDPNQYGRSPAETRRNRAIADAYEPGSTFKIVTGATALERGLIRLDEVIDTGHGMIRIGRVTINEDKHHDYGSLTLAGVFEHSSNIGIIRVGLRLGPERLFEGVSAFGIGRPTGVDLPGEAGGIFRPLSRWSSLSNASISMGQEVALTALQLARVAAVVANGGFLIQPRLVTSVRRPDGRVERLAAAPPVRVLSEETARSLRTILAGVVERGTGTTAAIPGFSVAGKTGTAQKAGPGGYQKGRYVPNFVGFVPADNPRVVAVVVVEEPKGKYYARDVAAPLFARVVSQALDILRVAPAEQRLPATVLASADRGVAYPAGVVPVSVRSIRPDSSTADSSEEALPPLQDFHGPTEPPGIRRSVSEGGFLLIPNVVGLSARQALAVFARLGLTARLSGTGFVVSQDPPSGMAGQPGGVHTLRLSETAPPIIRPGRGREETSSPVSGP